MANKTFSRIIRILTGQRLEVDDPFLLEASLSKLEKFAHFSVLLCGSFVRNRCLARAAAMSYTTLLAMIPMLTVAVGLATVFLKDEGKEQIETFVRQFVERTIPDFTIEEPVGGTPATNLLFTNGVADSAAETIATNGTGAVGSPDPIPPAGNSLQKVDAQERAAEYIHDFIQRTSFGTLGVTGVLALLLTAILTIASVENTFNDIWGVAQGRNWPARVAIYWTTSTLGAVLVAGAALLASGPRFSKTRALLEAAPFSDFLLSHLVPFLLICIAFTMIYKLLPNTRIDMNAAWIGGVVAGICWQSFSALNYLFASRAVGWSKLYGWLALVLLFMFGLYVMWAIVLFGAQVAYAFQNRVAYLQEKLVENVNQRGREFVALRLMTCIGQRFHHGDPPPTVQEISLELGVPSRLIQQVLQTLLAARLVVQVSGAQTAYAPARPLDAINCHHILLAMRATVGQELLTRDEPVRAEVFGEFARIQAAEKEAAASVSILALVNRAQARLQLAAGITAMVVDENETVPSRAKPVEETAAPTPVFPANETTESQVTAATTNTGGTADIPSPRSEARGEGQGEGLASSSTTRAAKSPPLPSPLLHSVEERESAAKRAQALGTSDANLANAPAPVENTPAEPEPVKPTEPTARSDEDDRGFPL
jgi:membrane protein